MAEYVSSLSLSGLDGTLSRRLRDNGLTGSLPIVKDLQDAGFDVQITGFGREDTYHAPNEFGELSHFETGMKICSRIISTFDRP